MKSLSFAGLIYCALASFGCGSSGPGMELLGSYSVMITSNGKSDPDVMTVTPGSDDKLLLTFAAGITTDPNAVNTDGLRASFDSSKLTLESQPVHIDHSTGSVTGNVVGDGTLEKDGTTTLTLHFTDATGMAQEYDVSGMKQ